MENQVNKIKPIGKIVGIALGIFILWMIFGIVTGKQSFNIGNQRNSGYSMPMSGISRVNSPEEMTDMEMMKNNTAVYDGGGANEQGIAQVFLQLADLPAKARLRYKKPLRSPAEVQLSRKGLHVAELAK